MYNSKVMTTVANGEEESFIWPEQDTGLWYGPEQNWAEIKPLILEHCSNFNTVIQAGGAAGMYPRFMSKMFKTVYSFEPDQLNFHFLVSNNQIDSVIKINSALGDKHHMVHMNRVGDNAGCNTVNDQTEGIVPVLMLDDFDFKTVDLIYLDVEGYELKILQGAKNTIEKFKPVIASENANETIVEFLKQFGYEVVGRAAADTFFKVI